MAYVQQQDDSQQNQTNPAQGPISPAGGGVHTSAGSGVGTAAMGSGGGGQAQPNAGGNFASLTQYVNANQGNAAPIASNITNQANQQYQSLQGQNQGVLSGIQGQVNSGYTAYDPTLLAQENANPVSFTGSSTPGTVNSGAMVQGATPSTPQSASIPNQSNISSFQKQLNDQYNGPSSAESQNSFQNQQATVNNAIATGNQLQGTEAGNQQLLQQTEKVNSPSTTGLNEAILYNDPNATAQVQHAFDPFNNLTTQLNQGAGAIDQSIAGAQQQAQQASTQANQQLQNQLNGVNTNIGNENTAAFNAANTNYQNLMSAFGTPNANLQADIAAANANPTGANRAKVTADLGSAPNLTPDQLASLGITQGQLQTLEQQQNQLANDQFVASPFQGNGSAWTQGAYAPISGLIQGGAPTQGQFVNNASAGDIATGNALNELAGSNIFTAPTGSNTYTGPTINYGADTAAYAQALQQQQQAALQQANNVADAQQAQHQASLSKGPFGGLLGNIAKTGLEYFANPLLVVPKEQNLINQGSSSVSSI